MTLSTDVRQEKLNDLYELGREQGKLTCQEIADQLEGLGMDAEQMDAVLDTLQSMKIEVVDEAAAEPAKMTALPPIRILTTIACLTRCGCICGRLVLRLC